MPKKGKKKSLKEKLREKQIKYQRALEAHRLEMEKRLEKKAKKWRTSKIALAVTCLFIATISICIAWHAKPPLIIPQNKNEQQTSQSQFNVTYIWPDGRVDPATAPIIKVREDYYRFTGNSTLPIILLKDNIWIDGAGYVLKGSGSYGSKGIDLSYRKNVTIINLKIEGFGYGIYLDSTTHAVISKNEFRNNYCGVWIASSSQNNITSNVILQNKGYGIWLSNSTKNFITENSITASVNSTAVYVKFSSLNTISYNILTNGRLGVFLYSSTNNAIFRNKIIQNYEGIHLLNSTTNIITYNDITKNYLGIGCDESSNNTIHHNNFNNDINKNVQRSTNIWDDGTKEGNYWSDYDGSDGNGDGIGDTPYIINDANKDRYPLKNPVS
jgi:parallel beta-helix repeat protein